MDNNRREKESKNNPQHTKRGHKAKPLRPFFEYSPQGKKKTQRQINKSRQDEDNKGKAPKICKEIKQGQKG